MGDFHLWSASTLAEFHRTPTSCRASEYNLPLHSACLDFPLSPRSSHALSLRPSFSPDVPHRRYDFLLRLQIYKVDHVTAGSFVSFVAKSSSFNILSCFAFRPKRAVSVSLFSRQMQHSYDNGKCNIQMLTYV